MIEDITERLDRIEGLLKRLLDKKPPEAYTPEEFAAMASKHPEVVRRWCRSGKLEATRANLTHGSHSEWRIPAEEYERYRREGLRKDAVKAIKQVNGSLAMSRE